MLPETPAHARPAIYRNPMIPEGEPIDDIARSLRNIESLLTAILGRMEQADGQFTEQAAGDKSRPGRSARAATLAG